MSNAYIQDHPRPSVEEALTPPFVFYLLCATKYRAKMGAMEAPTSAIQLTNQSATGLAEVTTIGWYSSMAASATQCDVQYGQCKSRSRKSLRSVTQARAAAITGMLDFEIVKEMAATARAKKRNCPGMVPIKRAALLRYRASDLEAVSYATTVPPLRALDLEGAIGL